MFETAWSKCGDGHWCDLKQLDLSDLADCGGVYIIWHEGNPGRVVRIGQGNIAKRLGEHRTDAEILAYEKYGTLRVTWAEVPSVFRGGIERYLADQYPPLIGDVFPNAPRVAVTPPFAA